MATSGTYNFTLDIVDIIEEAYERTGRELKRGYDYQTARRSLDMLLLEWQNRGLNLWTIETASQALTAGQSAYTLTAEKLDIVDALIRTNAGNVSSQTDLYMRRMSINDYARQTNKLTQGQPAQYWVEKAPTGITVNLWPTPDSTQPYVLFYYYMKRIEDSGKPGSNTLDIPDRYLSALCSGLAYKLAMKDAETMQMAGMLKQEYEEQWNMASDAARDKASMFVRPGGYRNL
jgi:hypothetical protein